MTHKILVIDDHPETLNIIQRVLQQQGYQVVGARSGFRGLSLAASENPDLILLDGMMPEMDGWEVCRRLRSTPELADIPIIMFSAVGEAEQKLAGFDAGADDYLTKPTEPGELAERVKAILDSVPPKAGSSAEITEAEPALSSTESEAMPPLSTTSLPSSDSNLIAVLGMRGGAGTTTLAINLAASLAHNNRQTTLLDLDIRQGHIVHYLNQKTSHGLNELLKQPQNSWEEQISAQMSQYYDKLQILFTHAHSATEPLQLTTEQVLSLTQCVAQPGHSVVVDCGHAVTAVTRPIIEQADQLVLCLRPERVALAVTKQRLPQLQALLFSHTQLRIVLFDFTGQINIPKQAVEKFLGHPVMGIIPVSPQVINQAVNKGIPLVQLNPQAKTAVFIRQIAQQLVKV